MGNNLKAIGLGILLGMMPVIVSAKEGLVVEDAIAFNFSSYDISLVDSVPKIRTQDDKDKNSKKKVDADKSEDPKQDPKTVDIQTKRPNIKEVPKARPKLRPEIVTDRVKVKRPPIRVKPGKILRSIGI